MKDRHQNSTNRQDPLLIHLSLSRGLFLTGIWLYGISMEDQSTGIVLLLGLVIFTILHYYFPNNKYLLLLEGIYAGGFGIFNPRFAVVFALPVLEGFYQLKPLYLLPGALMIGLSGGGDMQGILIIAFAALLGSLFHVAYRERDYYREESDWERKKRYEVEQLNREFLSLREEVYHIGELTERDRIAQQLHDDVGHELTGAVLSLQALSAILEEYELTEADLQRFNDMQQRVNRSAVSLRETVYRLKPYRPIGIHEIQQIVEEYEDLPVDLRLYGNTDRVPVHYWALMKIGLKEGLTNIMRHSKAREVKLQIDIAPSIMRFELENDGVMEGPHSDGPEGMGEEITEGIGLRNLRLRSRAYGGSLTTVKLMKKGRFRLVLVLPLKEETADESKH